MIITSALNNKMDLSHLHKGRLYTLTLSKLGRVIQMSPKSGLLKKPNPSIDNLIAILQLPVKVLFLDFDNYTTPPSLNQILYCKVIVGDQVGYIEFNDNFRLKRISGRTMRRAMELSADNEKDE